MSQARKDDDAHVVPPGLPGLHAFSAVLDGAVETVAATVRGEITANGTVQALAMGVLSDDPADPPGSRRRCGSRIGRRACTPSA